MVNSTNLWMMLGTSSPDVGVFHLGFQGFMNGVTELSNSSSTLDNNWSIVIRDLSFWLSVDSNEIEIGPNLVHQLIEVPLILG